MRYKDVIKLITVTYGTDSIGNQVATETEKEVYANMYSVSSTEYYNAALMGLRPSVAFDIYSFEYDGQARLKYDSKTYNIIRTETRGERTRLYCEEVAGV